MKERKPKLFRWALWWGLAIWAVSLIVIIINASGAMSNGNVSDGFERPIMDQFYWIIFKFSVWPLVLYVGVVGPVFEELVFRLWGNGKEWTGWTSVVLMALFLVNISWTLALVVLVVGVGVLVLLRSDRTKRLFALMMFSSLAFALGHGGNYDPDVDLLMFVVALLEKMGMALVASYLVINRNILWSMGLHILNNSLPAVMMYVGFVAAAQETVVVETDDYRLTMQPVLTWTQQPEVMGTGWISDSLYDVVDCPSLVAEEFAVVGDPSDTTYYAFKRYPSYYPRAYIRLELFTDSVNYAEVVRCMEREGWVALDTVADTITVRCTYNLLK